MTKKFSTNFKPIILARGDELGLGVHAPRSKPKGRERERIMARIEVLEKVLRTPPHKGKGAVKAELIMLRRRLMGIK